MSKRPLFITAISTDSGKTVVSSIVTLATQGAYWKPIQTGELEDRPIVQNLTKLGPEHFMDERYKLKAALAPLAAGQLESVDIKIEDFTLPETDKQLIIEGAGGILVPINDHDYIIDLALHFEAEVILVINHYLGCINHSLLSLNELRHRGARVRGIIFNKTSLHLNEEIILSKTKIPCLLKVPEMTNLSYDSIAPLAEELAKALHTNPSRD